MSHKELHHLELLEVGRQIQSRERSSNEVTRTMLARIDAVDPSLRSYAALMDVQALADAQRADEEIAAGKARGPLHGVPLAVKDLFWATGAPSAHGMTIHRSHFPTEDATVVRRLREAGAVILGKLQQTEGAFADHHSEIAPPLNPWDTTLWPGASSSGSGVATAAGLCFGTLGTDTAGSIRFPAAANGITGLKPTWGRVSRYGAFELAASLDHVGPMARSAADAGAMLAAIAGADPLDPTASHLPVPDYLATMTRGFDGLRVGIDTGWALEGLDASTEATMRDALQTLKLLGACVREVKFPDAAQAARDWWPLCAVETAVAHEATFPSRRGEYGVGFAGLIDLGLAQRATDRQKLLLRRADFSGRVRGLFEQIDLLLIPATAFAAQTVARMAELGGDAALFEGMLRYTCPLNLTGSPTITLPGGATPEGAPVGLQFVAPHFREDLLVRAGWSFQRATDWHRRRPNV
jgi:amidase